MLNINSLINCSKFLCHASHFRSICKPQITSSSLLNLVNSFHHSNLPVIKSNNFENYSKNKSCFQAKNTASRNLQKVFIRKCSNHSDATQSSDSDSGPSENEEQVKCKVMEASMSFVNVHGWTRETIAKGAESLGYSTALGGMFDKGGVELVNFFYSRCNSLLDEKLRVLSTDQNVRDKHSTTGFMRNAVEMRLRMNIPYLSSWSYALALHASPSNLPNALENMGTLVDTILYHAGDRSYDFSWYTKRGTLALVYKSTELCLLQDQSEDFKDTWDFLERRLENVSSLGKCVESSRNFAEDSATVFKVGCTTVQNMLGLNFRSKT